MGTGWRESREQASSGALPIEGPLEMAEFTFFIRAGLQESGEVKAKYVSLKNKYYSFSGKHSCHLLLGVAAF